jgi:hypothetical protein
MIGKRAILIALFSLLLFTIPFNATVLGAEVLSYKPYPGALRYDLAIKTHAVADSGDADEYGNIFRDHEDIFTLSQRVEETEEGLLDIATTVDKINFLPHGPTYGAAYKREEIEGNTQRVKIDPQGMVTEANVLPHIGSSAFWRNGHDGPPLDFYNVMILLNPRFPQGSVNVGESWEVEEEIELGLAETLPVAGVMQIHYELEMTVEQNIKYTLLDFVDKKGYRCARIGFEAEFRTDGVLYDAHTGSYVQGHGKSSGQLYFAPKEGILVSASMKHDSIERRSVDGQVTFYLTPEELIRLYSYDHTTIPIPWRNERLVTFELIAGGNKR